MLNKVKPNITPSQHNMHSLKYSVQMELEITLVQQLFSWIKVKSYS